MESPTTPSGDIQEPAALSAYHFLTTASVNWADQDALKHVNHKVFLGWMESNRVAYFERLGLWLDDPTVGVGIILAAISCNYRLTVSYPDRVHIGLSISKLGSSSIGMRQAIYSERANAIVADSDSTVVVFDYRLGKSCPIPNELRAALTTALVET
jgi:acyl-CoA thioester hydrolase